MFQPSHDHSRERVALGLGLFVVGLSPSDRRVQVLLILEPFNVLRAVRIDVLQTLGEFVIESVHEADDTTADSDDTVLLVVRSSFGEFIVVWRDFLHSVMVIYSHDVNQLIDLFLSGNPKVDGHVRHYGGIIVESGGHECQENSDPLILGYRDLEQFFEDSNLLSPISVLDIRYQQQENSRIISRLPSSLGPLEYAAVL